MDSKTQDFLQKLKNSGNWNDDYDYSDVKYKSMKGNITITFKKFKTKHSLTPNGNNLTGRI